MHSSLASGKWLPIGCLNHHTQLFVGDTVVVTFYDMQGELVDLSFNYRITSTDEGEPHNWPRLVAEHINVHIPLVEAGKMTEQGLVVAYRSNQIYALEGSGITHAKVAFNCIAKCKERAVDNPQYYDYVYPQACSDYSAGVKVLQPKTGHIYRCKPWPFSEFCRVKDSHNPLFEPGVGKSWAMAWQQISH
ncbi:chitin-binding protein [Pseudoalteromonas sp. bablab_jr011]|uniref:chitin-binding protein n=1 Tax=Pseudoalteromonas sp. bablab_jr011 TaxID=2755062 RepID=UPI0018F4BE24|nr:chitin-binding protein [Pseudoalteromonas sp. bablab_jr011]